MHYLYKTLNDNDYFRHLATLMYDFQTKQNLREKIVRFLYRSSCLFTSFHYFKKSLEDSRILAFQFIKQIKFSDSPRITFSCTELFLAYAQIPSALSAIVLMQDELIKILPFITVGEEPKSMSHMFQKGIAKFKFKPEIENILTNYWMYGGLYVRNLRNINEHYDILVNHTYFQYKDQVGRVLIFLPDNPEVKRPYEFTYQKENDAIDIIYKAMNDLNKLVNDICDLEGISKEDFMPASISHNIDNLNDEKEITLDLMISVVGVQGKTKELQAMMMKYIGIGPNNQDKITWGAIGLDKDLE